MTTPAEQEAERRYPETQPYYANRRMVSPEVNELREAFEDGAEWREKNPPAHIRELLETAGEYREADSDDSGGYAWEHFWLTSKQAEAVTHLLATAEALPGGTDAERPPVEERP